MAYRRIVTTKTVSRGPDRRSHVGHAAPYAVINQFIYLILGVIEGLLAFQFVFRLGGANQTVPFVAFVRETTDVLMIPFRFIFPVTAAEGAIFDWSILVGMFVYILFAWLLTELVRILYTASFAE
jgi:hypothetical protein